VSTAVWALMQHKWETSWVEELFSSAEDAKAYADALDAELSTRVEEWQQADQAFHREGTDIGASWSVLPFSVRPAGWGRTIPAFGGPGGEF
jgi:biopolymer transport protein ExbB/TolQ